MIAPSSSGTDQIALIGDRLAELNKPCAANDGTKIYNEMRFFCGDKPAQQFERGTQVGGLYKCGGCDCKDNMMVDFAQAIRKPCTLKVSGAVLRTAAINLLFKLSE